MGERLQGITTGSRETPAVIQITRALGCQVVCRGGPWG
jgi:hypothetical protein